MPFSGELSQCVATANPMAAVSQPLEVNTGSDKSTIVVEEHGDTDAYGFQLQVTC